MHQGTPHDLYILSHSDRHDAELLFPWSFHLHLQWGPTNWPIFFSSYAYLFLLSLFSFLFFAAQDFPSLFTLFFSSSFCKILNTSTAWTLWSSVSGSRHWYPLASPFRNAYELVLPFYFVLLHLLRFFLYSPLYFITAFTVGRIRNLSPFNVRFRLGRICMMIE